jgi:hypothetical protein
MGSQADIRTIVNSWRALLGPAFLAAETVLAQSTIALGGVRWAATLRALLGAATERMEYLVALGADQLYSLAFLALLSGY